MTRKLASLVCLVSFATLLASGCGDKSGGVSGTMPTDGGPMSPKTKPAPGAAKP